MDEKRVGIMVRLSHYPGLRTALLITFVCTSIGLAFVITKKIQCKSQEKILEESLATLHKQKRLLALKDAPELDVEKLSQEVSSARKHWLTLHEEVTLWSGFTCFFAIFPLTLYLLGRNEFQRLERLYKKPPLH